MTTDTSCHSTLKIIFGSRVAKSDSQSVPNPVHFPSFSFFLSRLQLCICQRFMDSLCFPIMLHYHTFQVTLSIYVSLFPISLPFLLNSLVPLLWSFSPSCLKLQIIHSTLTNHMYRAELAGSVSCATPGAFSCFSLFISPECFFFLPPILLLLCLVLCSSPSGNPVVKSGKDWLHERMSAGRSCPWNIQVCLSLSPLPLSPPHFLILFLSLCFFALLSGTMFSVLKWQCNLNNFMGYPHLFLFPTHTPWNICYS